MLPPRLRRLAAVPHPRLHRPAAHLWLPLQTLVPHRGAGGLAPEQIYLDHHREWGTHNAGDYGESRPGHLINHVRHQGQGGLPLAGSPTGSFGNRGVHIGDSVNARFGYNPGQSYQRGGSYGLPNSYQLYNGPRVSNETPGYNARESYRGDSAYNLQRPNRDLPNADQQHIGTPAPYRSGSAFNLQSPNRSLPNADLANARPQHIDTPAPYRSGIAFNLQSPNRNLPNADLANACPQHIDTPAPCRSGIAFNLQSPNRNLSNVGLANARQQHIDTPAPYRIGSAFNLQSPNRNLPNADIANARQQHIGMHANIGLSEYGEVQTYDRSNGYGTYNAGYNTQSNQQSFTGQQYGYGTSEKSYQNPTENDMNRVVRVGGNTSAHHRHNPGQPYQSGGSYGLSNSRQPYTGATTSNETPGYNVREPIGSNRAFYHQNPYNSYPNMSVNSGTHYPIPSGFHKDQSAGFQQGRNGELGYNASEAYQSPYVTSKADAQTNHPGYLSNVDTDVQLKPHGIHQGKHLDIQSTVTGENSLNSTPYQDVPGSLQNDGSPSQISVEASGKSRGSVEELEKLCKDGKIKEALEILALLQGKGVVLHAPQYVALLQACGDASALPEAREIHNNISQSQLVADIGVNNKILEMYAKCGSMEDAKKLFGHMAQHDLISWNTMISGFVHNGLGGEATDFFDQYKQIGGKPDSGMFTNIFLACGILGSVDEGMLHFESMQKDFGITPTMEHYASIVNMLGQSGYIDEAREFAERMPVEPSIDVWESLMNMCRLHGFLELGDRCAKIIECLDPSRLNEQTKFGLFPVRDSDIAKEKERKKASAIEGRSKVHEYRAGDRSHPEHLKIYEELRYLAAHMKEAGYIADTRFVLHDVDQETKEDALLAHSERLAVSYGLITSAARAPIRVIKNLRSCGDCHTALKIISKLVGRQIIARDAKRFHHFENGVCSCNDYW